jgi:hypothetical protein
MILDLIALDNSSKVWIYQSSTLLTDEQIDGIRQDLWIFLNQWTSHNERLYTYGNVFHERFIAFFVDERYSGASGCSIDKSVHFVEQLEKKYGISLFGRTDVAYMVKAEDDEGEDISKIHILTLDTLKQAYNKGTIGDHHFVFDNLVKTKGEFLQKWVVPLKESWHSRYL